MKEKLTPGLVLEKNQFDKIHHLVTMTITEEEVNFVKCLLKTFFDQSLSPWQKRDINFMKIRNYFSLWIVPKPT